MIAVQGPAALEILSRVVDAPLASTNYYCLTGGTVPSLGNARVRASRTGYTGEDGFEVIIRAELAERFWSALLDAGRDQGILPCGLGRPRYPPLRGRHATLRPRAGRGHQPV